MRGARRIGAALIVVFQLFFIVRAYSAPIDTFGFQMFPEASDWQADIYRVTDHGRISIDDPWPGGYRWSRMIGTHALDAPGSRRPAAYGLDATLFLLEEALDWVAANTPDDAETRYLEAEVTVWPNGRGPETLTITGDSRP